MQTDFRTACCALLLLLGALPAAAAEADSLHRTPAVEIGKGITYRSPGGSFSLTARLRMQNRIGLSFDRDFAFREIEARVKRLQIKFNGYVWSPKLVYNIQLSFAGHAANARNNSDIVSDAILYYRPSRAWSIGLGQTKIQTHRAQITSSGLLQFADRSIVNGEFGADRDFGLFVQYDLPRSEGFTFTAKSSVTLGEGRNWGRSTNGGLVYTRRLELYPLGRFKDKGESSEGDLAHEEEVRILLAGAFSYNHKAVRTQGTRGDLLPDGASRNFGNWYADFLLKYRGFSFCADFMGRTCRRPLLNDEAQTWIYAGWGFNAQAGYVIRRKWEVALRNSMLFPGSKVQPRAGYERRNQTTLGVSHYLVGHTMKIQADISCNHRIRAVENDYARWAFIFQLEIGL